MVLIISLLFLAATASAQLTTTFWAPEGLLGTDKVGYIGSVVNANDTHTTIVVTFDNGTNTAVIGDAPEMTMTVGPNLWEQGSDLLLFSDESSTVPNANLYILHCEDEKPSDAVANATCTLSIGPNVARSFSCDADRSGTPSTSVQTRTHSYSGRGTLYSAGVETLLRTGVYGALSSNPDWCTSTPFTDIITTSYPVPKSSIGIYQVIFTAGEEKLSATQAGSAAVSSATQTGSQSSTPAASGSGAGPASTGAAVPLLASGQVMMGLGAAVAAFFL